MVAVKDIKRFLGASKANVNVILYVNIKCWRVSVWVHCTAMNIEIAVSTFKTPVTECTTMMCFVQFEYS